MIENTRTGQQEERFDEHGLPVVAKQINDDPNGKAELPLQRGKLRMR